jgi:hypothetical protein
MQRLQGSTVEDVAGDPHGSAAQGFNLAGNNAHLFQTP